MYEIILKRTFDRDSLNSFDILIIFNETGDPQLVLDKDTQAVVEYLRQQHGKVMVKFNWLDENVVVRVPDSESLTKDPNTVIMEASQLVKPSESE